MLPAPFRWSRPTIATETLRDRVSSRGSHSRGQSLVEFALVLPMLLVLVLGVADFGRVFNASIVTESAARDSAETVAEIYLRNPPGPLTAPPVPPPNYYASLHDEAAKSLCTEMRTLPGVVYDEIARTCTGPIYAFVCVHDSADDKCNEAPGGFTTPPSGCSLTAPSNAQSAEDPNRRYVEVRVCYTFSPLYKSVEMPFVGYTASDIPIQRTRVFTVADY